jgi:hypothetical protein
MESTVRKRRPKWVWVICIVYALASVFTTLSMVMVLRGSLPLAEGQRQYFASLDLVDHVLAFSMVGLNLAGVVMLFILRRQAFGLMLTAFIIGVVQVPYHIVAKHWLAAMSVAGMVGAVLGWGLSIAVLMYIHRLQRQGILR